MPLFVEIRRPTDASPLWPDFVHHLPKPYGPSLQDRQCHCQWPASRSALLSSPLSSVSTTSLEPLIYVSPISPSSHHAAAAATGPSAPHPLLWRLSRRRIHLVRRGVHALRDHARAAAPRPFPREGDRGRHRGEERGSGDGGVCGEDESQM